MSASDSETTTPLSRYSAIIRKGKFYGHVEGIPVYSKFDSRVDIMRHGLHGLPQAGICGHPICGAYSICLSGGYEDDIDEGDRITYVGSGGRYQKEQICHQSFNLPPNKALLRSYHTQFPVRVIRGKCKDNVFAPVAGYRYDGLYLVENAEMRKGKHGLNMCTFTLSRVPESNAEPIPLRVLSRNERLRCLMKDIEMTSSRSSGTSKSDTERSDETATEKSGKIDAETTDSELSDENLTLSCNSESDEETSDEMDTETNDMGIETGDEIGAAKTSGRNLDD
ncbi:PUA-like domain-containing protein [Chiua virens]|nr:PUA-like domain-containing protein [Chiua virens]